MKKISSRERNSMTRVKEVNRRINKEELSYKHIQFEIEDDERKDKIYRMMWYLAFAILCIIQLVLIIK